MTISSEDARALDEATRAQLVTQAERSVLARSLAYLGPDAEREYRDVERRQNELTHAMAIGMTSNRLEEVIEASNVVARTFARVAHERLVWSCLLSRVAERMPPAAFVVKGGA